MLRHSTASILYVALLAALVALATPGPHSSSVVSAPVESGVIAYARDNEIRLIAPDGARDRRLWGASTLGDIWSLTWQPGGGEIAFASTHESACSINTSDIFVVGVDGSGYRRITEAPSCAALASYPSGTVEVPVENDSFLGESFTGFIYFQGAPAAQQLSLPPGGRTVVTFHNVADFGDQFLQVATMIERANREISFATAIDVLAGSSVRTGEMSVYSPYVPWGVQSPTWHSDGSRVGYVLNFNSARYISPEPSPLDFGSELLAASPSSMPDFVDLLAWGPPARANQLLYVGNEAFDSEAIYLVSEGSTTPGEKLLSYEVYEQVRGLAWLPDGSGFVYSVIEAEFFEPARANIYSYDFALRRTEPVTNLGSDFAGMVSVSPNGSQIVFERAATHEDDAPTDLWLVNRDGSGLRRLVQNGHAPAWGSSEPPVPPEMNHHLHLPLLTSER